MGGAKNSFLKNVLDTRKIMRIIFRVPMETMHVFLVPSDSMP